MPAFAYKRKVGTLVIMQLKNLIPVCRPQMWGAIRAWPSGVLAPVTVSFSWCGGPHHSLFFFFLIGVELLYNVVLVSVVQWSESAVCIHISPPSCTSLPPSPPSHPSRSAQSTELSSLCYTAGSHELSVLYMAAHICQSQSPNSSHPPHRVHRFIPYICVFIPVLQIGSSVPFL